LRPPVDPHAYAREDSNPPTAESMENEKNPDRSNVHSIAVAERPKRLVSRTRLVMGLLLIVAVPIFISLANKAVRENAVAIQQSFGR
jgi:ABC-type Fe2+-enterobactin transport system substrate-binding protein